MKPISFNKEMTQALLEGRKTQTRRPIKFEPHPDSPYHTIEEGKLIAAKSPYGRIGDLVWVREPFKTSLVGDFPYIDYQANLGIDPYLKDSRPFPEEIQWEEFEKYEQRDYFSPSEMPQWASRITLKITSIRVERVQDITEEDAKAEGCFSFISRGPKYHHHTYVNDFKMLWNEIYNNWDENPWVWVYGFEVLT